MLYQQHSHRFHEALIKIEDQVVVAYAELLSIESHIAKL